MEQSTLDSQFDGSSELKIAKQKLSSKLYFMRGAATLLVVIGHVIGDRDRGIRQLYETDLNVLGLIYRFIYTFHMPIFFIVSGISFLAFSKSNSSISNFISSKALRLIIPWICWAPFYYLIRAGILSHQFSFSGLLLSTIRPNGFIFWFFPAILFSISLSFLIINKLKSRRAYYILSFILLILSFFPAIKSVNVYISYGTWFYFNAFYAAGVMFSDIVWPKHEIQTLKIKDSRAITITLLIFISMLLIFYGFEEYGRIVELVNGFLGFVMLYVISDLLQKLKNQSQSLNIGYSFVQYLGIISMSVYLFHVFFSSSLREALVKFGLLNIPLQLSAGILVGLAGSIIAHEICRRNRVLRWSIGEK